MAKILLDHSDGRYSTRLLNPEEASELEAQGVDIEHIGESVYDAYLRHCEQDGVWQALWRSIANERYVRHRARELLPLEAAEHEIDTLKEALARSERLAHYFEEQWQMATGRQTRAEHENDGTYTCIFPQPGCDLLVLESDEWRATAAEILKKYKYDEDHTPYQGCCCGHTHRRLDPEEVTKLRASGFLVKHDSDPDETLCG
jgi:hypothetical protein